TLSKDPKTVTEFQRRERTAQKKCEMGNGGCESLATLRRVRLPETHRSTQRKRRYVKVLKEESSDSGGGGEDEKAEVEKKIAALQRIVPGGESLGIDKLFEETAGYIMELQGQVRAMRLLASFFEGLEKEKRKLGG
ncbi:hypothetical protein U1Q18_001838, partial [Sarracenia purpurea var. burkii]